MQQVCTACGPEPPTRAFQPETKATGQKRSTHETLTLAKTPPSPPFQHMGAQILKLPNVDLTRPAGWWPRLAWQMLTGSRRRQHLSSAQPLPGSPGCAWQSLLLGGVVLLRRHLHYVCKQAAGDMWVIPPASAAQCVPASGRPVRGLRAAHACRG
jgi:hypothetical protein